MELEYRVWDKTAQKMLYFEGIFNNRPYTERSSFSQYESCPQYHDLVIMPYTGRWDINGVKIYKDDITANKNGDYPLLVTWHNYLGSCGCCWEEFVGTGFINCSDIRKVIGNIWENPEMEYDKTIKPGLSL
jgi:hypothetical protein